MRLIIASTELKPNYEPASREESDGNGHLEKVVEELRGYLSSCLVQETFGEDLGETDEPVEEPDFPFRECLVSVPEQADNGSVVYRIAGPLGQVRRVAEDLQGYLERNCLVPMNLNVVPLPSRRGESPESIHVGKDYESISALEKAFTFQ